MLLELLPSRVVGFFAFPPSFRVVTTGSSSHHVTSWLQLLFPTGRPPNPAPAAGPAEYLAAFDTHDIVSVAGVES